jgi:hypothetical protein
MKYGFYECPYLANRRLSKCYEHARDQGTLGSVAGCRHSRTPGRTYDFLRSQIMVANRPGGP